MCPRVQYWEPSPNWKGGHQAGQEAGAQHAGGEAERTRLVQPGEGKGTAVYN